MTCELCGFVTTTLDLVIHLQQAHGVRVDLAETWPDGSLVIHEPGAEPEDVS
jgi:hypothetical protein